MNNKKKNCQMKKTNTKNTADTVNVKYLYAFKIEILIPTYTLFDIFRECPGKNCCFYCS